MFEHVETAQCFAQQACIGTDCNFDTVFHETLGQPSAQPLLLPRRQGAARFLYGSAILRSLVDVKGPQLELYGLMIGEGAFFRPSMRVEHFAQRLCTHSSE